MIKTLSALTTSDLNNHPCWKHSSMGNIELVSIINKEEISEKDPDDYVVLTEFILKDKTKLLGFCSPKDSSGIDYIQPTIITSKGHFPFHVDSLDSIEAIRLAAQLLDKNIDQIFPVIFITHVKCDGAFLKGQINNFNSLEV